MLTLSTESPDNLWTGEINEYLSLGGNMRSSVKVSAVQNQKETFEFSMDETLLYLQLDAIPNRLILYLDEQLAPGAANNREAFALLWNSSHTLYLKAGKMFFSSSGFSLQLSSFFLGKSFLSQDLREKTVVEHHQKPLIPHASQYRDTRQFLECHTHQPPTTDTSPYGIRNVVVELPDGRHPSS